MKKFVLFTIITFSICRQELMAQQNADRKNQFSLVFGLNQPIVTKGFNVEVNYWMKKWVIDYSHGFGLEFQKSLVTGEAKRQQLNFHITHSMGVGFGYRFTRSFNVRLEPKVHIWEVYYNDSFKSESGKIAKYNTYTLGLGLYYRWLPFEQKESILKGITIAPSFRWWPNIASSLDKDKMQYFNQRTGRTETHKANNIGFGNSPLFANISIGYTF